MISRFRELFQPDFHLQRINDIDLARLKSRGIKGLIIDIDNTIMPYSETQLDDNVSVWVNRAKELEFKITFVSNTLPDRAEKVEDYFDLLAYGYSGKPFTKAFKRALADMKVANNQIAVIGDQIFTDVLGGNRAGFLTILVEPLESKDFILTTIFRLLEKLFYDRVCGLGERSF
ncbi:MAG: YqeG family HAD IIIA-type phosphatase [Bacillota bacterium]